MTDALMQEAKRLHRAGRIADAAGLYQKILRTDPKHSEALYGLGMAHAQAGRLDEGQQLLGEALKSAPAFAEGWRARGMMLMHMGKQGEALSHFDRASALDPGNAGIWTARGSLLIAMRRLDEALASFDRALSIEPRSPESLCNRATLLFETGKLDAALAGFDAALAVAPRLAIVWNNRGNLLLKLQRHEEALASYERVLALDPEFAEASENRQSALFELGRTSRSPAKYMRGLFDEFSGHYDDTMLGKLGYRAHLHLRALAERVMPSAAGPLRILDLGCGTGLAGTAFKDMAVKGRLDGVDLSPRMIEAARARAIYDDLAVGDIESRLMQSGPAYDLIVSADAMIYFGDLARVFAGVFQRLAPGGFFLFTAEAKDGDGWEQTKVRRYRHSEMYLRDEAARAGLQCVSIAEVTPRLEENEPVRGFAVALRKPALV